MQHAEIAAKLQALVTTAVAKDNLVQNAILGVAQPSTGFTWSGAAGKANPTTQMTPETPYFQASVTKLYTAAAIMLLQERGKLSLDDKLTQHLPASLTDRLHVLKGTDYTPQITVRHLIAMTSGLADYSLQAPKGGKPFHERLFTEGDRAYSNEDVTRLVREELTPYFAPGAPGKAHYSDTNFLLLGAILEAVTETELHQLFADLFFQPLGLTQTYLRGYPSLQPVAEPAGLFHKEKALHLDQAMRTIAAHGGMVSTVQDSLRFLQAMATGELFARKETFTAMQSWNKVFFPMQYGLGLMRFTMPRWMSPFMPVPVLIGHSGSTGSFLYYCAERDLYLAGTLNQTQRQRATFPLMLKAAELFRRK